MTISGFDEAAVSLRWQGAKWLGAISISISSSALNSTTRTHANRLPTTKTLRVMFDDRDMPRVVRSKRELRIIKGQRGVCGVDIIISLFIGQHAHIHWQHRPFQNNDNICGDHYGLTLVLKVDGKGRVELGWLSDWYWSGWGVGTWKFSQQDRILTPWDVIEMNSGGYSHRFSFHVSD